MRDSPRSRLAAARQARGLAAAAAIALAAGCRQAAVAPVEDSTYAALRVSGAFTAARLRAEACVARLVREGGAPTWQVASMRAAAAAAARLEALPDSARARAREVECVDPASVGREDDWPRLLPVLRRQLAFRERWLGPNHPDVAETLAALSRLEVQLGNITLAEGLDARALAIRMRAFGKRHPRTAQSCEQLGRDHKLSAFGGARAGELYGQAYDIERALHREDSPECADVLLDMANLHRSQGLAARCEDEFARVVALRRRWSGPDSTAVADALADWAATDARFRHHESAVRHASEAVGILDRAGGRAILVRSLALNVLGQSLLQLGRYRESIPYLKRAAEVQEARWRQARPDMGRSLMYPLAAYPDWAVARAECGEPQRAFETYDRGFSRALVERMTARGELGREDPWKGLAERVRDDLPDTTALIGWADPHGMESLAYPHWVVVVRRSFGVKWFRVDRPPGPPPRLYLGNTRERLVRAAAWPTRLGPSAETESMARWEYDERIAPAESLLRGIRELVVLGAQINKGVPYELMADHSGFRMCDRFTISYSPSALFYAVRREAPRASRPWRDSRVLLVGSPHAQRVAGGGDLRDADEEVRELSRRFPRSLVLAGARASEAKLRALQRRGDLGRFDLIHFAMHTRSDEVFTRRAGLLLAESATRAADSAGAEVDSTDGRLTPDEVIPWSLSARLVTVASCRTAGISFSRTEGYMGLGEALLEAGAHGVLVSLWDLDDEATRLFVERFYRELLARDRAPVSAAAALRSARIYVRDWRDATGRQPFRHPVYWAGIVLFGDPG